MVTSILEAQPSKLPSSNRFGTFGGVFTPSILTILGVILYLRMGWVVGHAGLAGAVVIICLAHLISLATGLSVSSIATNRTVGAGGAYFMISRSLGAAAGAAIGIPLFLAQALSVTFYIVGFVESLVQLYPVLPPRLTGAVICLALILISIKSTGLAIRMQYFVMATIALSLLSFFLGNGEPARTPEWFAPAESALGFSGVFAVFFPAVTGIMAGVSMSGDLRDTRRSIPRGTLAAILVGWVIYLGVAIMLGLSGSPEDLRQDNTLVFGVARIPQLIYAGLWGATLSSALGSILAAPRTLQALAVDRLVPTFFASLAGKGQEPRNGLLATLLLAEAGILLGNLDAIAPILTMFFLATYGVTNLAFGLERWASSPSFRPAFQVPAWIGLLGAAGCFYVMSIINFAAMLAALACCGLIYGLAKRRTLDTTYGDARHGIWSALVLSGVQQLRRLEYHQQNWRPNLIILGGNLAKRSHLLELGSAIVQDRGMVTYFHILRGGWHELHQKRQELQEILDRQFFEEYPNVFCRVAIAEDIYRGAVHSIQSHGLGPVEANTVLLGWLRNPERVESYLRMLSDIRSLDRSLLVVRLDPEKGYGLGRRIDIWWRGLKSNGALMLLLTYLLTSNDRFRDAKVRVLTVVDQDGELELVRERLQEIADKTRIQVEPRVLQRRGQPISEIMHRESAGSDLVLIGLQLPATADGAEATFRQYEQILKGLPTTILVGSAPGFSGTPVLFDQEQEALLDPA